LFFNKRPIVVTYHNIIEDEYYDDVPHLTLTHSASLFDKQMALLREKLDVSSELRKGAVHVTFDDGYRNNLTVAAPILARHGVSATFFVPAVYFEHESVLWVDQMLMWLSHAPDGSYVLLDLPIELSSDQASKEKAFKSVWKKVCENYELKDKLLADMEAQVPFANLPIVEGYRRQRYEGLTPKEVESLAKQGHRTACHSYRHDILTNLADAELDDDFKQCERLAAHYNSDWYAYPFGRPEEVDDRVVSRCESGRYSFAFVNRNSTSTDSHRLPRINMPATDDKYTIMAKLSGFERIVKSLLSLNK
ncbi:MAG: polysaccharide deacetylase family protein, partial [Pseudomonadota bacterium]